MKFKFFVNERDEIRKKALANIIFLLCKVIRKSIYFNWFLFKFNYFYFNLLRENLFTFSVILSSIYTRVVGFCWVIIKINIQSNIKVFLFFFLKLLLFKIRKCCSFFFLNTNIYINFFKLINNFNFFFLVKI